MTELRLSEIWIYPIKSLGGIRLKSAQVQEKGLEHDRRWMLIDEDGMFITQRINHVMALFKPSLSEKGITIHFDQDNVFLPFDHPTSDESIDAVIWDDRIQVNEVPGEYGKWFSKHLGFTCKLVSFPESNARPVDPRYKINDENVSLADGYPFLIIGQSSLDDLNQRMTDPLPMNRFRPNFVFTGGLPYEEDTWRDFKINTNRFAGVKPCARCVLTTVDQETAIKGKEPLATLATYRRDGNKILFGQNVLAIDHGKIYEGDEITF